MNNNLGCLISLLKPLFILLTLPIWFPIFVMIIIFIIAILLGGLSIILTILGF